MHVSIIIFLEIYEYNLKQTHQSILTKSQRYHVLAKIIVIQNIHCTLEELTKDEEGEATYQ
jgi:hypothetical protein